MSDIKKCGIITLCGRPNVGKSTLTNTLVGEKVAIVSSKPQTTRNRICAILNRGDSQFVFVDTPGLHKARTRLGDYMVKVVRQSVADVDGVCLLVEPIAHIGPPEEELIGRIKALGAPAALVINKIDTVEKEDLLAVMDVYGQAHEWDAVVPISARTGDGVDELLEVLSRWLPEGPQLFPDDMVTDQPERVIVAEMIREKALRNLREEIPHGIGVEVLSMENQGDETRAVTIHANVFCEKDSHKGILIGKGGEMLRRIGEQARGDIERLLGQRVNLQLWVKVRPDWRNRAEDLRTLGYTPPKD